MCVRLQVMYYFLGKMFVLQPDKEQSFVREPDHPMLPPGPGLYTIHEPSRLASRAGDMRRAAASQLAGHAAELAKLARNSTTHLGNISPKPASVGKQRPGSLFFSKAKPQQVPPALLPSTQQQALQVLSCCQTFCSLATPWTRQDCIDRLTGSIVVHLVRLVTMCSSLRVLSHQGCLSCNPGLG